MQTLQTKALIVARAPRVGIPRGRANDCGKFLLFGCSLSATDAAPMRATKALVLTIGFNTLRTEHAS